MTNECDYCNCDDEDTGMATFPLINRGYDLGIAGGLTVWCELRTPTKFELSIMTDGNDDSEDVLLDFKYCPMCGRKLEEIDG